MRTDLPVPGAEERAHSERLAALIREEIVAAGGAIGFERFMELALYAPGLGYYSAGATKFGAAGDFITAPELGFVFARCLARALAPTLRETRGDILELGPGSGALAVELLLELERLEALPARYRLLERSADLRERQHAAILQHCAQMENIVEWLDRPPDQAWSGCLIANEVIDALPVRLFALREAGLFERTVGLDAQQSFVWCERSADAALIAAVADVIETAESLPRPYLSEVRPMLAPWFVEVAGHLQQGTAVFVDYGYSRAEYYAPQRSEGTLRCHYRHRAHDDPLIFPGLQDITAWVDFDRLAEAGAKAGFALDANITQAQWLIAHGLGHVFDIAYGEAADEVARYRLAQEVKQLTLPGGMGDRFRVVALRISGSD